MNVGTIVAVTVGVTVGMTTVEGAFGVRVEVGDVVGIGTVAVGTSVGCDGVRSICRKHAVDSTISPMETTIMVNDRGIENPWLEIPPRS